jgi:hypothetical protein
MLRPSLLPFGFAPWFARIADNLSKTGWSCGYVSTLDSRGRTIWIADAHRGDGKRFVGRVDELLTAFLQFEAAIRGVSG